MLGKFLCWIGRHHFVPYIMIESEYSKITGHRCKRCLKVVSGQEGMAELAQFYAERRKSFIIDVIPQPYIIVADDDNESVH